MKRSPTKARQWAIAVKERCTDDTLGLPVCEVHEAIRQLYHPARAESIVMATQAHHVIHKSQWPAGAYEVRNGCGCCVECHDTLHAVAPFVREVIYAMAGRDEDYQEMRDRAGKATQ